MTAPHLSVLLSEVVEALAPAPGKLIVDGTFGAGGYSRAFLQAGAKVIAFDRDPTVAPFVEALSAEFPGALRFIGRPFSELADGLADAGETACDGLALDIGVSSMQIDQAARGFSFQNDGPLDMRMSADGPTAADLINNEDEAELARIFYELGEERASRGIARALVRRRAETPFTRTLDLADTVERAVGGRRGAPIHPATRVFQALRIAVNDELGELTAALRAAESYLRPGGRLAVVSFHSLEDRIVKSFLTERSGALPQGSRHAPVIAAKAAPTFALLQKKAVTAQDAETWRNPRARSAKLRAAIRTEAPAWRVAA